MDAGGSKPECTRSPSCREYDASGTRSVARAAVGPPSTVAWRGMVAPVTRVRDAALARWYARGELAGPRPAAGGAPAVIDLFCGAGGFTRGFAAAGCRPVLAVDLDPACVATYVAN